MGFSAQNHGALIADAGAALGIPLDAADVDRLARFVELVSVWSSRVNLTGARDPHALVDVLLADALALRDLELAPQGARFVDVGAGAGAPAIPLLLLRPDLRATLVEPLGKRTAFLRTAIGTFDLATRAALVQARWDAGPLAERFDVALSRATFDPREWLARGFDLAPRLIVFTGEAALPEDDRAELVASREYALPFARTPRRIGVYAPRATEGA